MKIFFLDQIGNINNKYSISLCNAVNKLSNLKIWLVTNDTNKFIENPSFNTYIRLWKDYTSETSRLKKLLDYYFGYYNTLKHMKKEKIQVFHCQWFIFSPLDYYFLKKIHKAGIKIVVTVHDVLPFNSKIYDKYFHKKIYQISDFVIAQANENYNILHDIYHVEKNRMEMIPHGHFMDYAEVISQELAKDYFKISKDNIVILFFGQIKKVKGLDILISSFSKVLNDYPNITLMIAGKVWKDNFDEYEKLIKELRIEDKVLLNIHFIEEKEIKYFFSAADIVVLPYKKIYQSGVVQLAFAYSKAVIASDIGGFKDVISNMKTGLLVKPGDVNDLANAIEFYLANPQKMHEFGIEGKKAISKKLSWEKIAKQLQHIYFHRI